MQYYPFDPKTGEALPPRTPQVDPLETAKAGETVYAGPGRYETPEPTPAPKAGKAIVRYNGKWSFVDDKRGETFYKLNGDPVVITELGQEKDLLSEQPPAPPKDVSSIDILNEYDRRLSEMLGAVNGAHAQAIISQGNREALRLLKKGADTWTAEETARVAQLEAVEAAIEALDNKRDALLMKPVLDYKHDKHWT